MASQLWQRLREVRKMSSLRQADLAKAAGVTRSGYAFWETPDDASRTVPNVVQINAIAAATKVPVEWLLDDSVDISDLWKREFIQQAPAPAAPAPPAPASRTEQTRWRVVEYLVASQDPARAQAFEVSVPAGAIPLVADYLHQGTLAIFSNAVTELALIQDIARALLIETASKRRVSKLILVWTEQDIAHLVETARRFFGVAVVRVASPEEAAAQLLAAE
jgi:transcriptional regulator with XRE-family HTH domain